MALNWRAVLPLLNRTGIFLSALSLAAIMLLIVAEAIMRYIWGRSLGWTYDLVTFYLIVVAFFLAVGDTFVRGGNVSVETAQELMPWRLQAVTEIASSLIFMIVLAAMIAQMWGRFSKAWTNAEVMSGVIAWPTWPTWAIALVGFGLLMVNLCVRLVRVTLALARNRRIAPLNAGHTEHME